MKKNKLWIMNRFTPSLGSRTSYVQADLTRRNHDLMEQNHQLRERNEELMNYATMHTCKEGQEFSSVDVACVNCRDGAFRNKGAPRCLQCAEGMGAKEGSHFCTPGNEDSPTVACPHMHVVKGYNGTAILGTNCQKCDTSKNQYKVGNNIDLLCDTCPPGSTIDHRRLLIKTPRRNGHCADELFTHQVRNIAMKSVNPCAQCEPGTVEAGGKCINCPIGKFTDEFGQTACKTCENPNSYAFLNEGGKTCENSKWHTQQGATGQNTYLSSLLHAFDFSKDEGYESKLTPRNQEEWASYMDRNGIKMCEYSRN